MRNRKESRGGAAASAGDDRGSGGMERTAARGGGVLTFLLKLFVAAVLVLVVVVGGPLYRRMRPAGVQVPTFGIDTKAGTHSVEWGNAAALVSLNIPAGNVAVSATGRVLFNFHPEYTTGATFAEVVDDSWVPRPDLDATVNKVLSLRVDTRNRLWLLDFGNHGITTPALVCFQLGATRADDRFLFRYEFPSSVAGLGSMLNDFAISQDANHIYIADTSPFGGAPALVYYSVERNVSHRLLDGHVSVVAEDVDINVNGDSPLLLGPLSLRIPVDSIALDREREVLYFAPVSGRTLYRISTKHIRDAAGTAAPNTPLDVAAHVQVFSRSKCISDGIAVSPHDGAVLLTCFEHSVVGRLALDAPEDLQVVMRDAERLQWPDGFEFDPRGRLLVTSSGLHHQFTGRDVKQHAPFFIMRLDLNA